MNVEQYSEEAIFKAAIKMRSATERIAYVKQACGSDADLLVRLETLLRAHDSASDFLETPPFAPVGVLDIPPVEEGPGTVIGRYKLLERIGEGGMAVVYMAEQAQPIRRKVALKIIKLGMDTRQVIARFEAERQVLALMDHPSIAKVLDAGATETGRPYFVMELVTGVSITEYCNRNSLSTKDRLGLFIQVCNAVQHAHQKGIIHRDIKPSNVMVTHHDGKPVPKVIDFGIAKATNQRLTEKTLFTRYAHIIGTPAYMSPEQAELSDVDIDTRSDIYSLGVLLYELLTGTTPFSEEELRKAGYIEMQRVIREQEPAKPSTKLSTLGETLTDIAKQRSCSPDLLRRTLRGDLDWIVMKSLEKDRARRYDSTSALLEDIKRHLDHEPVSAGPPGTWYRTKKFLRRHQMLVLAATVVVATIIAGLAVSTSMYLRAQRALGRESVARAETQLVSDFFADDLLASVYPENTRGQDVTVRYILDHAAKNLDQRLKDSPLSEAKVLETVGLAYRKLGDYKAAEQHLQHSLSIRRDHLGTEHPSTLAAMTHLGSLYVDHGRFEEAEPLLLEAIELQSRVLGKEHENTFESMGTLGWQYTLTGRGIERDRFIDRILTDGSRVLGEEHPVVLKAMSSRAYCHLFFKRYEEAESLARKGLRISQRVLGVEHEQSLYFRNLLTYLYLNTSQYKAGVIWGNETLETCQRVLGEEHPASLLAMRVLGDLYRLQGMGEQAMPLLVKSTEVSTRVLGGRHLYTLLAMYGLSELYRQQGYDEQADALICQGMRTTAQFTNRNGTPNMYFRLRSLARPRVTELRSLARSSYDAGDYEEVLQAIARLEEFTDDEMVRKKPIDLKLKTISLIQIGDIQQAQHALSELRTTYDEREYVQEFKGLYETEQFCAGIDHETFAIWDLLAQGEYEEASNLFRALANTPDFEMKKNTEIVQSLTKALTRQHGTLARAAKGRAEYDKAIYHYQEAIAIDPSNGPLLNELAQLLAMCPIDELRDGARAVSFARQLCEITGWDHAPYIDTLACAYAEAGDFAAAIRHEIQAIRTVVEDERSKLRSDMQHRLQLFQSGAPYHDRAPSLVAWWPFEPSNGRTAIDASGNHFDGNLTGDAEIITDPKRGHVLSLQGNGYVDFDDHQILEITGPMTLSCWIMAEAETQYANTIIDYGKAPEISCSLRDNGKIFMVFEGLNADWHGLVGGSLLDKRWHHVVGIYDGTEMFLYIDGQLNCSSLATGFMRPSKHPVCIGANSQTKKGRFTGLMDDIRIYNYALTEAEIKAVYTGEEAAIAER